MDQAAAEPEVKPGSDAEHPASVEWVSQKIQGWIRRLGDIWIDGQLSEVSVRRGNGYLTLRDSSADCSLPVFAPAPVLKGAGTLEQGDRVVVKAGVDFWAKRGQLMLKASSIRKVGLGEWLAELEKLKALLAAEGLFRGERKRRLPFLPQRVGLICGRGSDAEHDVVTNARRRWPAVSFETRYTAVQGVRAVQEVVAALKELDAHPQVDVIVIARGGGAVEDLLAFSNEALVRAVAAAGTPVVSAIGHEKDAPILDFVADMRASTPTDAGKRIVPDYAEEVSLVRDLRGRCGNALRNRLVRESDRLLALRSRPVLAEPIGMVLVREQHLDEALGRARRCLAARLDHDTTEIRQLRSRVRALSPAATLDRGYAVVQTSAGSVIRDPAQAVPGDRLRVRVSAGEFAATPVKEEQ
jgi:exodeoxyribonuclease VII large subunit